MNFFVFANNNPVFWGDFFGLLKAEKRESEQYSDVRKPKPFFGFFGFYELGWTDLSINLEQRCSCDKNKWNPAFTFYMRIDIYYDPVQTITDSVISHEHGHRQCYRDFFAKISKYLLVQEGNSFSNKEDCMKILKLVEKIINIEYGKMRKKSGKLDEKL